LRFDHGKWLASLHVVADPRQPPVGRAQQPAGEGWTYDGRSTLRSYDLAGKSEAMHERSLRDRLVQRADLPLLFEQELNNIGRIGFRSLLSRMESGIFVGVHEEFADFNHVLNLWAVDPEPKLVRPGGIESPLRHEQSVTFRSIPGQVDTLTVRLGQIKRQRAGAHRLTGCMNGHVGKELGVLAADQVRILHEKLHS
jgi:hypothetical protein